MPYVSQEDVRIYYETEGAGPPLVLLHGGFGSHVDWRDYGYVAAFREDYTLILIDSLGHGQSDKPHEAEQYNLKHLTNHVVAVLDDQDIDRAHLLGYSMGGWICFGLARYWPQRLRSLIILDHHPYSMDMTGIQQGARALAAWVPHLPGATESHKVRLLQNDPEAMVAASVSRHKADVADALSMINIPSLIVAAGADQQLEGAKRCADAIKNSKFVSIDGLDHTAILIHGHQVISHVVEFLANINQS